MNSMFKRWNIWKYMWNHEYTHIVAYYKYSDIKSYFLTIFAQFTRPVSDFGSI